jgi:hypothetical protein
MVKIRVEEGEKAYGTLTSPNGIAIQISCTELPPLLVLYIHQVLEIT